MTTPTITGLMAYLPCIDCRRPMRPYGTTLEEHPGTVCRAGQNCSACANTRSRGRQPRAPKPVKLEAGTPCKDCGKSLRPKGTKAGKYPGTIPHQAGGKCRRCHLADPAQVNEALAFRAKTSALGDAPDDLEGKDAKARARLDAYMAARRARGIPTAGIPVEAWARRTGVAA